MDHKAAEHEEQRHAKSGRFHEPEHGALRRRVAGHDRTQAVRQHYREGGQEAQAGQCRYVLAAARANGCGHRLLAPATAANPDPTPEGTPSPAIHAAASLTSSREGRNPMTPRSL